MNSIKSKEFQALPYNMQKWVDGCQILYIRGQLVALPYKEALQLDNYAFAGTIAAICTNKLLKHLIETKI